MPEGRRAATKAANRQAILDAAADAFAELGYGATTVRDIVRRTDLAAGTFYNHFPDKESVLRELVDEAAEDVRARMHAARAAATDLASFVRGGFDAYFSALAEDPRRFGVLRRNAGTIRAMFDQSAFFASQADLAADIRAAIAAGLAPPDVDVELTAAAMVGAGYEVGVAMLEQEPADVERAVVFATGLFLPTLGATPAAVGASRL